MLFLDFETKSELDLKEVGLHNYARHPSTDAWCVAVAVDDAAPVCYPLAGADTLPRDLLAMIGGGQADVVAHNAPFELEIWNEIMAPRYGWPRLRPEQTLCTMAQAYAMGLPGGLEDAALALGLSVLKDTEGRALMLRMARPRRMEGSTPIWWDDADKLARLYAYCSQDVRVEQALYKRLQPLSAYERRVWLMDRAINTRGVAVDLVTAKAGATMAEQVKERAGYELASVTSGAVASATALIPLKQWLKSKGCDAAEEGLAKDDIAEILAAGGLSPEVTRALEIRQEAGKASVAKLDKMLSLAGSDGRLHDSLQYYGSHLGRWAARGVQVHNLVRSMPPPEIVEDILASVRSGEIDWIKTAHGPPMQALSSCLRSFFVAPEGKMLVAGDFAGVESRGTAWIAGEEWKLRAFREADAKIGPGVYELTASKTLGLPVSGIKNPSPERQIGKVQELAFGYGGGVGAARKFLPLSMRDTPDATLNKWKLAWRAEHPRIKAMWKELEQAAIAAVQNSGVEYRAGYLQRGVTFKKAGSFLWCKLPSGRVICYPYPKLLPGNYGDQLTYMSVPSADDISSKKVIADVKNANNWARVATYGGSLMENVVQAICRDLLVQCMLQLHDKGALIVLHVHDEIIIEVPEGKAEAAREAMQQIMRAPPDWAKDFPLYADCKPMKRYGKG